MTVDEAIASFIAKSSPAFRELDFVFSAKVGAGDLRDLNIFFLGDFDDLSKCCMDLEKELLEECRIGIPLPFDEVLLLIRDGEYFSASLVHRLENTEALNLNGNAFSPKLNFSHWIHKPQSGWRHCFATPAEVRFDHPNVEITISRDGLFPTMPPLSRGKLSEGVSWAVKFIKNMCHQLALISHPANYIIKESPQLTSHEAARVEAGKRFPDAKRPRYIIVDHDVLVGMQRPQGTHTSPVPHKRRGHWMRLAERCRHAKERGVEKVFVRDCYIGDVDFIVNNRRYQVLLDFQDKSRQGHHESDIR